MRKKRPSVSVSFSRLQASGCGDPAKATAVSFPMGCSGYRCRFAIRRLLVLDPNGLRVYESVCTEMRKLPSITAVLDAADGNTWVR